MNERDRVQGVHIYPVKSCQEATVRGEYPTELRVGVCGFEADGVGDRDWLVVDEQHFYVSQRGWNANKAAKHPGDRKLATVAVDIRPDHLVLRAPGKGSLEVPTENTEREDSNVVGVHGNVLWVHDEGDEAAAWFSSILERSVRLVRADRSKSRLLAEEYQRNGASNRVTGADGMPFLLAAQASLDELHRQAGLELGAVPLNRYRASIDVSGEAWGPFAEDYMRRLQIGSFMAFVVKPCARCPIPNVDQRTGERDNLSTRLLLPRLGWKASADTDSRPETFFGQNLNHVWVDGYYDEVTVAVGDTVTMLERDDEPNVRLRNQAGRSLETSLANRLA